MWTQESLLHQLHRGTLTASETLLPILTFLKPCEIQIVMSSLTKTLRPRQCKLGDGFAFRCSFLFDRAFGRPEQMFSSSEAVTRERKSHRSLSVSSSNCPSPSCS